MPSVKLKKENLFDEISRLNDVEQEKVLRVISNSLKLIRPQNGYSFKVIYPFLPYKGGIKSTDFSMIHTFDVFPEPFLVSFRGENRKYIKDSKDIWRLKVFFEKIEDEMFPYLTDAYVEAMFRAADFHFYLNEDETCLFVQETELTLKYFGKLHSISAIDALKRFGLFDLAETREFGRLKVSQDD